MPNYREPELGLGLTTVEVSTTAVGNTTIIPAPTTGSIGIFRASLTIMGATTLLWQGGANNRRYDFPTGGGALVFDIIGHAWYQCLPGQAFVINNSAGVQISGEFDWALIP